MLSWYIRVDCFDNEKVGTGHLRRCIAFASYLVAKGDLVHFLINDHPLGLRLLKESGLKHSIYSAVDTSGLERRDMAFIDLYDDYLDQEIIGQLGSIAKKLIVITDSHEVEEIAVDHVIATNQSLATEYADPEKYLVGPPYFIMANEFRDLQRLRSGPVERILIAFGGYDPFNVTKLVVDALIHIKSQLVHIGVNILLGTLYPYRMELEKRLEDAGVSFIIHQDVVNISEFYSHHDFAITAAGNTFYELATLGIPCNVIAQNNRQHLASEANKNLFKFEYLGLYTNLNEIDIAQHIGAYLKDNNKSKEYSDSCIQYFKHDGKDLIYNRLI